jgi:hypothetical protein
MEVVEIRIASDRVLLNLGKNNLQSPDRLGLV